MRSGGDWCILRTAGAKTLALAKSLHDAGFDVWAPSRTIRRPAPGQRRALVMGRRRKMIEVEVAILPRFVFARADQLDDLARTMGDVVPGRPDFSIFQIGGRVPIVSERSVAGLREEERRASDALDALRDAESREEARRQRAEQMRNSRAKLKVLRRERKTFQPGEAVIVPDMPALAGTVGHIVKGNGASAVIDFGGTLTMQVEAWRVMPVALQDAKASAIAA